MASVKEGPSTCKSACGFATEFWPRVLTDFGPPHVSQPTIDLAVSGGTTVKPGIRVEGRVHLSHVDLWHEDVGWRVTRVATASRSLISDTYLDVLGHKPRAPAGAKPLEQWRTSSHWGRPATTKYGSDCGPARPAGRHPRHGGVVALARDFNHDRLRADVPGDRRPSQEDRGHRDHQPAVLGVAADHPQPVVVQGPDRPSDRPGADHHQPVRTPTGSARTTAQRKPPSREQECETPTLIARSGLRPRGNEGMAEHA